RQREPLLSSFCPTKSGLPAPRYVRYTDQASRLISAHCSDKHFALRLSSRSLDDPSRCLPVRRPRKRIVTERHSLHLSLVPVLPDEAFYLRCRHYKRLL